MYLKYIEIQGFKSFAKKIKFEFQSGITGIVGPNGSGKSNVADAVRWVLGEQKIKQLRSSRMEDVIFAGTANRKPQGFAYVSIIFDNSDHELKIDFDEVTISRRLYRSGESEYMINGSPCRLRDVNELFYDTGIGKEGYSIIGQGQIDKILQGKPEERRELFDEAAGIVKYKKRKNIALRKLESEQQSLVRISDILSELEKRVGPLKRQSEAARKYVDLSAELKKYDINLFLLETDSLRSKIRDLEEKEEIVRGDLEESAAAFEETKEGYDRISDDIVRIDDEIASLKEEKSAAVVEKESLCGRIGIIKEQINSAKEADKLRIERANVLKRSIALMKENLTENEKELSLNKEKIKSSAESSAALDEKILEIQNNSEELRLSIEKMKEELVELVEKKGNISASIERLNATLEQMEERRHSINEDIERFGAGKEAQEEKLKSLKAEFDKVQDDVSSLENEIELNEADFKKLSSEISDLNRQLTDINSALLADSSRLDSLTAVVEQYEGYAGSIREIMKLKAKTSGILGVVADLTRTEKKYETAIETALGGNIQNVVTDTETCAKQTIEYLKKNKLGRATFLPLSAVKGRREFNNPDVLREKGVIGLANNLVDVDKKFQGVINFLLGQIIVVDNINNALQIARKYGYSLNIVTLEGEHLNRGGSLTGGAFKKKSNFLGRYREMDELKKSVAENEALRGKLEGRLSSVSKDRDKIAELISEKKDTYAQKTIYLNTVRLSLEQAEGRVVELKDDFARLDEEKKNIDEQTAVFDSYRIKLDAEFEENDAQNDALKEKINESEKTLSEMRAAEADELRNSQEQKIMHSRLIEHERALTENAIRIENELANAEKNLKNISREVPDDEISEKTDEIEKTQELIKALEISIENFDEKLSALEDEKQSQSGSHRNFIDQREEYSSRIANLDKELFRLSSAREKLEEKLEESSSNIWFEYGITYKSASESRDETLSDINAVKNKVDDLKAKIKRLGNINVGSIEEYREVKERFEFLKTQHDDLIKAENDLNKIIKNLDKEMRNRFASEFKRIGEEFERVFKEMFGGGTGSIELEEDIDILDAGIRVTAQPPGKKLQNMMQLSGGEKALTAIAVLFAIQNLKPSPFCILDEIEAALDDSNIGRFAAYLKGLSSDIQFIVITHRKGTMEACDRLYGITMQEKGVSTLVSVNLADFDMENV